MQEVVDLVISNKAVKIHTVHRCVLHLQLCSRLFPNELHIIDINAQFDSVGRPYTIHIIMKAVGHIESHFVPWRAPEPDFGHTCQSYRGGCTVCLSG